MERRKYLKSAAVLATIGTLSGCQSTSGAGINSSTKDPSSKPLKEQVIPRLEGNHPKWNPIENLSGPPKDFKVKTDIPLASTIEGMYYTRFWENTHARTQIKNLTLDHIDTQITIFFATKALFKDSGTFDIGPELAGTFKSETKKKMEQKAKPTIENYINSHNTLSIENYTSTGDGSGTYTLLADIGEISIKDVTLEENHSKNFHIDIGKIPAEATYTTTVNGNGALITGGIYPTKREGKDIDAESTTSVTGNSTTGLNVGLTFSHEFKDYKNQIETLKEQVK